MSNASPARPALRYYGGKWKLAPWIISHFPAHECYVEPFGGAASVLLRKPPAAVEVWNDLDGEVVNFFEVLRGHTDAFMHLVDLTPYSRAEYEQSFDEVDDPVERARRFYVRSWQGFGAHTGWRGSWRVVRDNKRGRSPVDDWNNVEHLWTVARRLKSVFIEQADAFEIIHRYDAPATLFYVDPPYLPETRSKKHRYPFELDEAQHAQLAAALHEAAGMVVLSGYPSASYGELYAGWECITKDAVTNGNVGRTEAVWLNAAASRRRLPLFANLNWE